MEYGAVVFRSEQGQKGERDSYARPLSACSLLNCAPPSALLTLSFGKTQEEALNRGQFW